LTPGACSAFLSPATRVHCVARLRLFFSSWRVSILFLSAQCDYRWLARKRARDSGREHGRAEEAERARGEKKGGRAGGIR